tara:strand:+ start:236 stop:1300 length:1065 start_codon:yes stop_codon:yes gene_type:complete
MNPPDNFENNPQLSEAINLGSYHRPNGYSHDGYVKTSNPNWLSKLPDDTKLSHLSIPGTHDSMSFYGGDAVQTQSMSLENQLKSGIRAFDIRCRLINGSLAIHHGAIFQKTYFNDVLNTMVGFLKGKGQENETIYMRVKKEYTDSPKNPKTSFQETFEKYWNASSCKDYVWRQRGGSFSQNPSLKETRGKIVLLQDFESTIEYGISYKKSFNIQDVYKLKSNWSLYDKWLEVKNHLHEADRVGSMETSYINYLSSSTGSFPYFVASGQSSPKTGAPLLSTGLITAEHVHKYQDFPKVDCLGSLCTIAFEGTNNLTSCRLGGSGYANRIGILMIDFPGPELISGIINKLKNGRVH